VRRDLNNRNCFFRNQTKIKINHKLKVAFNVFETVIELIWSKIFVLCIKVLRK